MLDRDDQLQRIRASVVRSYADRATPETVEAVFDTIVADFAGAPIQTFVPVLAERRLRELFTRIG